MRWAAALLAALVLWGCQCGPTEPPATFACDGGAQCLPGWDCVAGLCVELTPDAGS